jgi:hypothetical protein
MMRIGLVALLLLPLGSGGADAQQAPRGLGQLGSGSGRESGEPVDVELILAVDVSWSMDRGEQEIQRNGYVAAFRSPEVQQAITRGNYGKVAVTFVEWAGSFTQNVVVPWTLIDSKESADAFAYRLSVEEPDRERRTSISGALDFAAPMFAGNGYVGQRRVIDVSGDGPNNQGRPVTEARAEAVAKGITINGLPLMTSNVSDGGYSNWGSIPNLDKYYADCVIGGPGAFMIPVNDWPQFPEAIRRKLVLELAGGRFVPKSGTPFIVPAGNEGVDCLVGENQWQQRENLWNR